MCTVSWLRGLNRLELFTNRDEQRSRPAAEPPRLHETETGGRYLAPVDPSGGGTWVAVNEHGLILCLVNHYQAAEPAGSDLLSRGGVVTAGIHAGTVAAAMERCEVLPFDRLRGFRLLALRLDEESELLSWDGASVERSRGEHVAPPLISSSVRLPEVEEVRRTVYGALLDEHDGDLGVALPAFHRSRSPEPGPLAVNMTREDARTVSHTHVVVDGDGVRMSYWDGPPTDDAPHTQVTLQGR